MNSTWVGFYLKNRKILIPILRSFKKGVIQGSILGPLFFNNYNNDITIQHVIPEMNITMYTDELLYYNNTLSRLH